MAGREAHQWGHGGLGEVQSVLMVQWGWRKWKGGGRGAVRDGPSLQVRHAEGGGDIAVLGGFGVGVLKEASGAHIPVGNVHFPPFTSLQTPTSGWFLTS